MGNLIRAYFIRLQVTFSLQTHSFSGGQGIPNYVWKTEF
jgi:hypothetical protein